MESQAPNASHLMSFFLSSLIELEEKNTYLVYWTIHEEVMLQEYLSDELYARFAPDYLTYTQWLKGTPIVDAFLDQK